MSKGKTNQLSDLSLSELQSLLKAAKKQEDKIKGYERKKKALQKRIEKLDEKIVKASQSKKN